MSKKDEVQHSIGTIGDRVPINSAAAHRMHAIYNYQVGTFRSVKGGLDATLYQSREGIRYVVGTLQLRNQIAGSFDRSHYSMLDVPIPEQFQ